MRRGALEGGFFMVIRILVLQIIFIFINILSCFYGAECGDFRVQSKNISWKKHISIC